MAAGWLLCRLVAFLACWTVTAGAARAQITAPRYEECLLAAIFPAGGRQGETVTVELLGGNNGDMSGALGVVIDGPPGITVRDVKNVSTRVVQATLVIARDAAPGRRHLRVLSERSGLTNMLYFSVGRSPEVLEKEPNNDAAAAQAVSLPVVVNGRVNPKADVDCFAFRLTKGRRLVAAVLAHSIDSHGQSANYGIVDANLQLLDDRGRVVAEAGDTLGLDPQLEFVAPADGQYAACVSLEAFEGFPQAVYRLVLGEMPMATSIFPPGGQRGTTAEVELSGPNVPAATRQKVTVPAGDRFPLQHVVLEGPQAADLELPFLRGDWPEKVEAEPNGKVSQATPLEAPMTANGRIGEPGDEDWYRLRLATGQSVCLETTAQRYLRSPLDTLVEVYDPAGKKLAANDDGFGIDYVSMHDFRPMDSRLVFAAPAAGDYYVRVSDQSGGSGPRSVYRLTVSPTVPDFELYTYPDGVPIWGPGSTAALLVKVNRYDSLDGDITLAVEGLPSGWVGSQTVCHSYASKPRQEPTLHYFLTITAPPGAKPGDMTPFRVVGRSEVMGRVLERVAQPLTLYYSSDVGFFRSTPVARAVVTRPQTPWLASPVKSLSVATGGTVTIPLEIHDSGTARAEPAKADAPRADKFDRIDLTADLAAGGVATALAIPQTVPIRDGKATLQFQLGEPIRPGRYGITVSLRWRSDIRIGMPGPCTPLLMLDVTPPSGSRGP